MADLMQELRSHAEQLDRETDPITWAEVTARTAPAVAPARRQGWLIAAAAGAAVLVLVGVVTSGTLFGGADVASSGDIVEPQGAPATVNTPYGDVVWYEITGSQDRVPGINVTGLADGTWVAGDQDGRSWTSNAGIRWTLSEESGSTVSSEDLLDNGVWTRQLYPDEGPGPLSVSFDGGATFVPVEPPTDHPDENLAWTDNVMSVAPLGDNPEDGIMVIWMANGSIPWADITGIQDTILNIRGEHSDGVPDGTIEIASGPGEDATNITTMRMALEGEEVVVYDTLGIEQWRHVRPADQGLIPSEGVSPAEVGVEDLAYRTYAVDLAAQVITPSAATVVPMPDDVDSAFDSFETMEIGETFALFAGDELRLVGYAPPLNPETDPTQLAIWRWTGSAWERDAASAWFDADVAWVSSLRTGSDEVIQVAKSVGGIFSAEWWLDWDRVRLEVPPEVVEGALFEVPNGFIGTDAAFEDPRFWYSPDGGDWAEITSSLPAYGESNNGGARRVWAEGNRVFAIDEPFDGNRTFRVADISGLSAPAAEPSD
jgi:hypothetical protein